MTTKDRTQRETFDEIPFVKKNAIYQETHHVKERFRVYADFIGGDLAAEPSSLNIGSSEHCGDKFKVADDTHATDFNRELSAPGNSYRLIYCFEVLEHVMNPLQFMEQIRAMLHPEGVVYLSTPAARFFSWYQSVDHFTEYRVRQLHILFNYAGFRVTRYRVFDPFPWWWHFTGIRPLLRWVCQRTVVFRLEREK